MALVSNAIRVIEQSHVSPPAGSAPTTSLPLTIHDLLMHLCCPLQHLSFYEFPHSKEYLIETIIPSLKNSLSQALQHYFPFAGNLMCPCQPSMPYILYTNNDSIPFTVAIYEHDTNLNDFITAKVPRSMKDLHLFVPKLPPTRVEGDMRVFPIMAVQVTILPNLAFSIGVTFSHIVADGMTLINFLSTWASICKNKCLQNENSLPFHDRSMFKNNISSSSILKDFWNWASTQKEEEVDEDPSQIDYKARFTFVIGGTQIERLKRWVKNQSNNDSESLYLSSFTVVCALTWVCFVKAEMTTNSFSDEEDQTLKFGFPANYRSLYENPIPSTYFGNCLVPYVISMKKRELLGANGIVAVARAIGKKVRELKSCKDLEMENLYQELKEAFEYHMVWVASSPNFCFYENDFGWGRPKSCDFVHIEASPITIFTLSDTRDDKYGIEISMTENRVKLEHFKSFLEESLRMIDSTTID